MCSSYTEVAAMNFNIYLDDETGQRLSLAAQQTGENRNALVRRAVSEWLNRHGKPQWPDEVLAFRGMADMPAFEAGREGIKPPVADPLA
jgi:predicted transcriptional regulator